MRVVLAADHAGFALKQHLVQWLIAAGHEPVDLGTASEEPVDYPPLCAAAARAVVSGDALFGVVLGGSGQGEQIAANKVVGARAALCHDEWMAEMARRHNDANVLAMGGRVIAAARAESILQTFLTTSFDGGRHARRIAQIADIERDWRIQPAERRNDSAS
ncbi:MAG: ribose 5-phosphate isomerase B [Acidimicrobiales bacterium]